MNKLYICFTIHCFHAQIFLTNERQQLCSLWVLSIRKKLIQHQGVIIYLGIFMLYIRFRQLNAHDLTNCVYAKKQMALLPQITLNLVLIFYVCCIPSEWTVKILVGIYIARNPFEVKNINNRCKIINKTQFHFQTQIFTIFAWCTMCYYTAINSTKSGFTFCFTVTYFITCVHRI